MCGLEGRVRQLDVALLVRIQLYIYRIDLIFVGCCGGAPAVVIGLRCRCDGPLLIDIAYAIACSCARHSGWSFGVLLTAADGVHPVPELQPSHAGTTNALLVTGDLPVAVQFLAHGQHVVRQQPVPRSRALVSGAGNESRRPASVGCHKRRLQTLTA